MKNVKRRAIILLIILCLGIVGCSKPKSNNSKYDSTEKKEVTVYKSKSKTEKSNEKNIDDKD